MLMLMLMLMLLLLLLLLMLRVQLGGELIGRERIGQMPEHLPESGLERLGNVTTTAGTHLADQFLLLGFGGGVSAYLTLRVVLKVAQMHS